MSMADATRLRVVSYNIHGLGDDRAALDAVVAKLAPDVVVAQEAPRRFRWRTKCAQIARSWGMLYAAGGLPSLGNLIVTSQRVFTDETWCIRYPLTPGRHMRGAVFARCSIGDVTFTVAGSHLSTDAAERPVQAQILNDALAAVSGPLIFGCDVNETSTGPSWQVLASGLADLGAAADSATFTARNPRRRIDALFASPDVQAGDFFVADVRGVRDASDHLPVVADLAIRPPR
jgi:endonuclease/exonuclease/phosphatase family metal-dependent hydrolase